MTDPIDYRDWKLDAPQRRRFVVQMVGGAFAGAMVVSISGVPRGMANVHYTSATQPLAWQTTHFDWEVPLCFTTICLTVLGISVWIAHRSGRRGFVLGSFCGAGLLALVEGICFMRNLG